MSSVCLLVAADAASAAAVGFLLYLHPHIRRISKGTNKCVLIAVNDFNAVPEREGAEYGHWGKVGRLQEDEYNIVGLCSIICD